MEYVWKTIKQFFTLLIAIAGIIILINSFLIILYDLNWIHDVSPFFNINLKINYNTGISFSVSDIINITFELIIGLWFTLLGTEAFINGIRFFSSDNVVLKTHTIRLPGENFVGLLPDENLTKEDLKVEPKQEHVVLDKPIKPEVAPHVDKERFAQIIEKSSGQKDSSLSPREYGSVPPLLVNTDISDKADKIEKEVTKVQKPVENKKAKPKEEPIKTLNLLSEDKNKEEKKGVGKPEPKSEKKLSPELAADEIEDNFLRKPSLKTFFRYLFSPASSIMDDELLHQDAKPKEPKHVDLDIIHKNID